MTRNQVQWARLWPHGTMGGPLRAIFGHFGVILAVRARGWSLELLHFLVIIGSNKSSKNYWSITTFWGAKLFGSDRSPRRGDVVHASVCPFVCLSVCLFICLSVCLFVCLSVRTFSQKILSLDQRNFNTMMLGVLGSQLSELVDFQQLGRFQAPRAHF